MAGVMRALMFAAALAGACGAGKGTLKPEPAIPGQAATAPAARATVGELTGPVIRTLNNATAALRTEVEAAFAALVGQPLDRHRLRITVAQVMRMRGVADLDVEATQLADGIELVVAVTMQPVVRTLSASADGAPIALGTTTVSEGAQLDPMRVQALVQSLRERYLAAGHLASTARWRRVPAAGGGVDVVIEVEPGPASTIGSLGFQGSPLPVVDLTNAIVEWLPIGGPLRAERLERATLELNAYHWERGYATVQIRSPQSTAGRNAVVFEIAPGPLFRISAVTVKGDVDPAQLSR